MTDIVERLRFMDACNVTEAANEIIRLREDKQTLQDSRNQWRSKALMRKNRIDELEADNTRLREALKESRELLWEIGHEPHKTDVFDRIDTNIRKTNGMLKDIKEAKK